jgi:integrase
VADADEWAAGWRLTLCGLRRSEVLGMKWESVDLARGEACPQGSEVSGVVETLALHAEDHFRRSTGRCLERSSTGHQYCGWQVR